MPDRGSLAAGSAAVFSKMSSSTQIEILTSQSMTAPQNDKAQSVILNETQCSEESGCGRQDISTSHIFPNQILHFTQNDIVG